MYVFIYYLILSVYNNDTNNRTNDQYFRLTKMVQIAHHSIAQTIIDTRYSKTNCVYLIIRGCVRIFSQPENMQKGYYEEDLFPGKGFSDTYII